MTTEIICKEGDLFSVTQIEGIAIFISEGVTAIRCDVKNYIDGVAGQPIYKGVYRIANDSPLKLVVTTDMQCDSVESMRNELARVLEIFKRENVRTIAMNGIRCDNRPDASIRPEKYQKKYIEQWLKDNPETFNKIELVDLRGGFNK